MYRPFGRISSVPSQPWPSVVVDHRQGMLQCNRDGDHETMNNQRMLEQIPQDNYHESNLIGIRQAINQ